MFDSSISVWSQALNPLLVWFDSAYNQCCGELPINTPHSTSVASSRPTNLSLRAKQNIMWLSHQCTQKPSLEYLCKTQQKKETYMLRMNGLMNAAKSYNANNKFSLKLIRCYKMPNEQPVVVGLLTIFTEIKKNSLSKNQFSKLTYKTHHNKCVTI